MEILLILVAFFLILIMVALWYSRLKPVSEADLKPVSELDRSPQISLMAYNDGRWRSLFASLCDDQGRLHRAIIQTIKKQMTVAFRKYKTPEGIIVQDPFAVMHISNVGLSWLAVNPISERCSTVEERIAVTMKDHLLWCYYVSVGHEDVQRTEELAQEIAFEKEILTGVGEHLVKYVPIIPEWVQELTYISGIHIFVVAKNWQLRETNSSSL